MVELEFIDINQQDRDITEIINKLKTPELVNIKQIKPNSVELNYLTHNLKITVNKNRVYITTDINNPTDIINKLKQINLLVKL